MSIQPFKGINYSIKGKNKIFFHLIMIYYEEKAFKQFLHIFLYSILKLNLIIPVNIIEITLIFYLKKKFIYDSRYR